ncbi:MAG: hypothetical protein MKZ81_01260 [Dehalococcoidia bacterium]|nr:hypothetical protein [Dehalococcoidia bacterium]
MPDNYSDAENLELQIAKSPQRISGMRVLKEQWKLPGKPADLSTVAADSWRQTNFNFAEEIKLIENGLNLEARFSASAYTLSARNMDMAGFATLWSRSFLTCSDITTLIRRGGYQSAMPLIRQAVELIGAQWGLTSEIDTWRRWTHEAFNQESDSRAIEQKVGHYFSGESIASDPNLRIIYKAASDFGRPNFGPSALFVANGANRVRYPLIFADQAFHIGWAELIFSWLMMLNRKQLHLSMRIPNFFPIDAKNKHQIIEHIQLIEEYLSDDQKCRIEEYEDKAGRPRHLMINFRRQLSDQRARLLF